MTDNNKKSLDNVIRFPVEAVSKFGFARVKKPTAPEAGKNPGQLDLFAETPAPGDVVRMPGFSAFDEALLLDEHGDERTAAAYWKAIEEDDRIADAYCNLGVMESRQGRTAKAFDCFTNSLKFDPRHFESHFNLANLYFDGSDYRLARSHYEMAGEIDPDAPNVFFNLGLADALEENFRAAITALTRYKELAPDGDIAKADELITCLKLGIGNQN